MSSQASPTETADACPRGPAAGTVPASPVMQGPGLWSLLSFVQPPAHRALPGSAFEGLPRPPCPLLAGLRVSSPVCFVRLWSLLFAFSFFLCLRAKPKEKGENSFQSH